MPDFAVKTAFTAVDRVSPAFNKMSGAADRFGKKTTSMFSQLAGAAGMFGGVALIAMGFKKIATSAMMIENAQAAFTPLLGSVEKATQLVDMLNVAAAETPFQFEDLTKVAQQLLPVMNGDLNNTIRTMKMLGDTAGGNAQKLDSITRGYTKAMLKGKVDMESLNMIAEAGVPIHTQLAESMGYGKDRMTEFFKKVSSGTVGVDDLNKAFVKMTSEGGLFFNGMIIASKTTSGVLSTMSDNLTMVAGAIGTELLPTFKDIAISISETAGSVLNFVRQNKSMIRTIVGIVIPAIKWLVIGLIAWKVYTWAVILAQKAMVAVGWIQYLWMMQGSILKAVTMTKLWTAGQWLVNAALYACPFVLITGAIIALGAAIAFIIINWDDLAGSIERATVKLREFLGIRAAGETQAERNVNIEKYTSSGSGSFHQGVADFLGMDLGKPKAPNESNVAMQSQNNTTVNINSNGTEASAEVTPRQNAKINMNLGYQN